MLRTILLSIFITLLSNCLSAQDINKFIESQETVLVQKLYLHTDREFYFIGDTLWFSAYLLEGKSHAPLAGNCNLYVELLNQNGDFLQKELFLIKEGHSSGYLSLSEKNIKKGKFLIRAYTDYLKQFGDDMIFTKAINISDVKNSSGFELAETKDKPQHIILDFFPEGGFLLNGKMNTLAFKAINTSGKEVDISGKIFDDLGNMVVDFKTFYKGMGCIYFVPDINKKYRVKLDGQLTLEYKLPKIRTKGAKLMLASQSSKGINLNIITHENKASDNYYVAFFHRGVGIHYFKINGTQTNKILKIKSQYLKNGINRLILLNNKYEPISERLVFCNLKEDLPVKMDLNKTEFGTRQKVSIHLNKPKGLSKNEFARLSVSVVNANSLNSAGISQNIKSYLLSDSELKGNISASADYFRDSKNISSQGKLSLLMLTNGWSNYLWNTFAETKIVKNEPQLGLAVHGKVEKFFSKKPLENTEVTLSILNNVDGSTNTTYTNNKGEFKFNHILFSDSALIAIQGKNHREKTNTTVKIHQIGIESPTPNNIDIARLNDFDDIPVSMHRMQYLNELALREFYPDRNTRVLEEIRVVEEYKKEDDGHYRLYGTPNHSGTITNRDLAFKNVFQYLQGRFPGVMVVGNSIKIRGRPPIFLVNGIMVESDFVKNLPMLSIDKVEVIKGPKTAVFGVHGANGAIAIYTKKGSINEYVPRAIPGTIMKKVKGFAPYREFYSPKYTAKNIQSEAPDFRTTLYWNPLVAIDEKNTSLSFYTCDNLSEYKILVEGITTGGKILLGEAEFKVNKR